MGGLKRKQVETVKPGNVKAPGDLRFTKVNNYSRFPGLEVRDSRIGDH
jgi:hypothetical protein